MDLFRKLQMSQNLTLQLLGLGCRKFAIMVGLVPVLISSVYTFQNVLYRNMLTDR